MLMIVEADDLDELVMVMMVVVVRWRMRTDIRTDKLGESREEAKKFLEEVEAMEREAHQVVVVVIGITIIRGTPPQQVLIFTTAIWLQVSDRCMKAVKACQGLDTRKNPLR